MSAAVAAILEGMPEPRDLRMLTSGGRCVISAESVVLFDYDEADTAMRNIALATLRQLGFKGRTVAAALGLTENYVSTLHNAAMRDGSAALTGQPRPGRPGRSPRRSGSRPGNCGHGTPATRRSAGSWGSRTPRSAAAWARAGRRQAAASPAGHPRNPCSPSLRLMLSQSPGLTLSQRLRFRLSPRHRLSLRRRRTPDGLGQAGRAGSRRGRWCPRGCSGPGTRGRCCCTGSSPAPARGRCWPAPAAGRRGRGTRRCWPR